MDIRRFDDLEAFAARVVPHLERREAEHNLELGIIAGLRGGRFGDAAPLLLSVEDEGEVLGVAIRTPPFGLLLSSEVPAAGAVAVTEWLLASDDPVARIPGVQGEVSVTRAFVEAWERGGGAAMSVHREERIYRLTAVEWPEQMPAGQLREVRATDREVLLDWFAAFAVDVNEPDPLDPEIAVAALLSSGGATLGMAIWEVDGAPRAMAGYSGPTPHGIRVGPVYTPPDQRPARVRGSADGCAEPAVAG